MPHKRGRLIYQLTNFMDSKDVLHSFLKFKNSLFIFIKIDNATLQFLYNSTVDYR